MLPESSPVLPDRHRGLQRSRQNRIRGTLPGLLSQQSQMDLVRLNDDYGRQSQGYEGLTEMRTTNLEDFNYFHFDQPKIGQTFNHRTSFYSITLEKISHRSDSLYQFEKNSIYSIFEGHLTSDKGGIFLETGDTIEGVEISSMSDIKFNYEIILFSVKTRNQ